MSSIVVTPGDPAGIGPDILLKLVQHTDTPLVAIADRQLLVDRAAMLELTIPQHLQIEHVPLTTTCTVGQPNPHHTEYILSTLQQAAMGCQQKKYQAMVTGPISKAVINQAGINFTGHTDWLAGLTKTAQTVMLFVSPKIKVALYSTHIPLNAAAPAVNKNNLRQCLSILHQGLQRYFAIAKPRIAVCGLNPHAGEQGHLGQEEINIMQPVLAELNRQYFDINGPIGADTAFTPNNIEQHDAILAMYHDQGLPVIKALSFNQAVNVTLGLPFIRTSVDHGTGFDIAGTGLADDTSLKHAVSLAIQMARMESHDKQTSPS